MNKTGTWLFVAVFASVFCAVPAFGGAVITNGSGIYLGVANYGNLGFTDGITTTLNGAGGTVGVAVIADLSAYGRGTGLFDATTPGCICEGWGAAANGIGGGADGRVGGIDNLGLVSFQSSFGNKGALSVTMLGGTNLQIIQLYTPTPSNALYVDFVTLRNTGTTDMSDVRYRGVMDWDIPPGEDNEFVTIGGWPATALLDTSDNGFASPNPLSSPGSLGCPVNSNFTYCGPGDHGALFDFGFGSLAAGKSKAFYIFYGAAFNHAGAMAALGTVGAEVYSLGNWGGDTGQTGQPITYIFGFKDVGGTPVAGVPEPSSIIIILMGTLGVFLFSRLRRRA